MEGSGLKNNSNARPLSLSERALNAPIVRSILQSFSNAPQKLKNSDEEAGVSRGRIGRRNSEIPLTKNYL